MEKAVTTSSKELNDTRKSSTKKASEKPATNRFLSFLKSGKLTPLFINILLLFFLLLFFVPVEKTDDFNEKTILSGAFSGEPSAHLLYSGYIYGGCLKLLQQTILGIAWYEVLQYIWLFISFTIITSVVLKNKDRKHCMMILLPILIYFGYESYIKLTFTKTAGIAVAAGFFLMFYELKKKKMSKLCMALSVFMIFVGALLRYNAFKAVFMCFLAFFIYEIIFTLRTRGVAVKRLRKYTLCFVGVVVFIFVVRMVDKKIYRSNEAWNAYRDYNTYKAELQDYGWPEYEEYKDTYEEMGISYNDYVMWGTNRNYSDPDIYTLALMKRISAIKGEKGIYDKYIKDFSSFFKEYPLKFFKRTEFLIVLSFTIIMAMSNVKHRRLLIAGMYAIPLMLEYYLFCNGRYGQHHVDMVIMFCMSLVALHFLLFAKIRNSTIITMFLIFMGIFVINKDYTYLMTATYYGKSFDVDQETAREVMDMISADKENLYVVSYSEFLGILRAYDTFETIEAGSLDNVFILSTYMYPSHRAVLEKYNINNIYKHLCDNNVYYITSSGKSDVEVTCTYLQEHYNPNASYKKVNKVNNAVIYKFK